MVKASPPLLLLLLSSPACPQTTARHHEQCRDPETGKPDSRLFSHFLLCDVYTGSSREGRFVSGTQVQVQVQKGRGGPGMFEDRLALRGKKEGGCHLGPGTHSGAAAAAANVIAALSKVSIPWTAQPLQRRSFTTNS